MNYNIDFSKDEITNMKFVEGEYGERTRRVKKKARNANSQETTTQQEEGQDGIPLRNILNYRKIINVGQQHVEISYQGETRKKEIVLISTYEQKWSMGLESV